jgi:hypothetical protein
MQDAGALFRNDVCKVAQEDWVARGWKPATMWFGAATCTRTVTTTACVNYQHLAANAPTCPSQTSDVMGVYPRYPYS